MWLSWPKSSRRHTPRPKDRISRPTDLPAKIQISLDALARPRKAEQTIVLEQFLARIEEELIRRALARAKGNKTKAARLLGMTRPRLYRRLVQLGLEEPDEASPDRVRIEPERGIRPADPRLEGVAFVAAAASICYARTLGHRCAGGIPADR